ncbi:MAG TPA: YfhO family protein [Ktedonobacteraceae bacterium]|nr:YfhO family protein [Ktedonobacteraceae bacterium]
MKETRTLLRQLRKVNWVPLLSAAGQLAVLVAVAVALLYPAPFQQNQLPAVSGVSDVLMSHWPFALLIQRTFAQEHALPLWNPYIAGGQPLDANPLAAFFYPPTQLVHFFSLRDYFLLLFLAHLVFAGVGMLLLARLALKLSPLAALAAAVSYMATPALISHLGAGHVTIIETVAWYPWVALTCWATVREPLRRCGLFGICVAMMLLAGHPQMAYYGLLMIIGMAAWLLTKRWYVEGRQAALSSLTGLIAGGGIAVLLAAAYLLPLLELTAHSTRQLSLNAADSYPLLRFLQELIDQRPPSYPAWEKMLTPGLTALVLALLAVAVYWRRVWPLLLAITIVAALAMGNALPFYRLAAKVLPDFNHFRDLTRIWFVALMLFAVLAGLGAEALLRGVRRVWPRGRIAAGFLLVLIVALSLVKTDTGYAHDGDIIAATTPTALARTAAQLAGSGRVYDLQRIIPQRDAVALQMPLADGQDPLLLEDYVTYMQRAGGYAASGYQLYIPNYDNSHVQPRAMLLGLVDISIVVSRRPLSDPLFMLVEKVQGVYIYKNTADAGPGYFVLPGPSGKPPSLDQVQQLNANVRVITLEPEQQEFTFSTAVAGYFVIAIPAFPGWSAVLDGHVAQVQLIGGTLPAIKVGPGTHTLSYIYAPSSLRYGALLSASGLLVILAWLFVVYFWRPRNSHRLRRDRQTEQEATVSADSGPSVPVPQL